MKKILSIVAMCLVSLSMMAQTSTVATLTHNGVTTEYYGVTAFANAVAASTDGDLITLSPGSFNGATINKSLNIRGAGTAPSELCTTISSEVIIDKSADPDESNHWLNIEGINFEGQITFPKPLNKTDLYIIKDLHFKKCTIKTTGFKDYYNNNYYYATLRNCSLVNCRVIDNFNIPNESEVSFINTVVYRYSVPNDARGTNPKINFMNSVLITNSTPKNLGYVSAQNSVIVLNAPKYTTLVGTVTQYHYVFPSTTHMTNCLFTGNLDYFYSNELAVQGATTNCQCKRMDEVFESVTSYTSLEMDKDYSLTVEGQDVHGTDGTQVGIYGGAAPYSNIVTYPRFGTFNVGEKAVDGKLPVIVSVNE